VLVNNAGEIAVAPLESIPFEEIRRITAVRLKFRENAGNPCGERV